MQKCWHFGLKLQIELVVIRKFVVSTHTVVVYIVVRHITLLDNNLLHAKVAETAKMVATDNFHSAPRVITSWLKAAI